MEVLLNDTKKEVGERTYLEFSSFTPRKCENATLFNYTKKNKNNKHHGGDENAKK